MADDGKQSNIGVIDGAEDATAASQSASPGARPLGTIIPGQYYPRGSAIVPVFGIGSAGKENLNSKEALELHPDSRVDIAVADINLYDKVFLRFGNNPAYPLIKHKEAGYIWFSVKENLKAIAGLKDGDIIWVELQSANRPEYSGLISYYLVFDSQTSEEEQDQKNKAKNAQQTAEGWEKEQQANPNVIAEALINPTLGGIAGALGQGLSGRQGSQSVSPKSQAQGPVAAAARVTDSVNDDSSFDDEAQLQTEEVTRESTETSTIKASTGSQVVSSEAVNVSGASGGGAVSQTQTTQVSSGQAVKAEVTGSSGGGVQAAAETTASVSGAATPSQASTVSGQGAVKAEAKVESPVSNQAEAQSRVSATAQSTTSAQGKNAPTTAMPPQASASVKTQGGQEIKADGQIQDKVSASASSAPSAQQAPAQPTTSRPSEPVPSQPGKGKIDGIGSGLPQAVQQAGAAEVPKIQSRESAPREKSPLPPGSKAAANLDSAGIKPPAGLESIFQNRQNLNSRLDLRQSGPDRSPTNNGSLSSFGGGTSQIDAAAGQQSQKDKDIDSGQANENSRQPGGALPEAMGPDSAPGQNEGQEGNQQQGQPGSSGEPDENQPGDGSPGEDSQQQQDDERGQPQIVQPAAAALSGPTVMGNSPIAGIAQGAIGQTTSKLWWWGFGLSAGTFFTGLDFMAGAAIMDIYWWRSRKQPKLFPMKGWQKIVTVIANILPPIIILFFTYLIMVVGCNYPVPKSTLLPTYRGTIIGLVIGDECKYFDISNITSAPAATTTAVPGTTQPSQPAPVTPRN